MAITHAHRSLKWYYIFFGFLFLLSAGAVFAQFRLSQGPKIDLQTVEDLDKVKTRVESYVQGNDELPHAFSDLKFNDELINRSQERKYTYKKITESTYEICATFQTKTLTQDSDGDGLNPSFYDHAKGVDCFIFESYPLRGTPNIPRALRDKIIIAATGTLTISDLRLKLEFTAAGAKHEDTVSIGYFDRQKNVTFTGMGGSLVGGVWKGDFLRLSSVSDGKPTVTIIKNDLRAITNVKLTAYLQVGSYTYEDAVSFDSWDGDVAMTINAGEYNVKTGRYEGDFLKLTD